MTKFYTYAIIIVAYQTTIDNNPMEQKTRKNVLLGNVMNSIIHTTLCGEPIELMLDRGFFEHNVRYSSVHKHRYAEVHILASGSATYNIDDVKYTLVGGSAMIIPSGAYHSCDIASADARHCSFIINTDVKDTLFSDISPFAASELLDEIDLSAQSGNYIRTLGYISLIFSQIYSERACVSVQNNRDDDFIIDNYIEKNYASSPSIAALAKELNRSVKQSARLVQKYTGCSFREAVTKRRMAQAKILMDSGKMSKEQISERVGYSSYSGFYKAYKKFSPDE